MALQYLHNRDLIFRALNTENVVIDADGYVKLVDFQQAAGLVERCVVLLPRSMYALAVHTLGVTAQGS
jgi:serine/threonine protein kinase